MSGENLINDPNWRQKAPYGLHVDGSPLTKEEYEALKTKPTQVIKVNIDSKQMEELIEEKKSVEEERDDLAEKLNLIAENAFEKKKRELGAPDDITTPEQLQGYELAKKGNVGNNQGGSAPLNSQYGQQNQGEFSSMESLIDSLRDRSSANNKNMVDRTIAKNQLDALMTKAVLGQRETNKPFSYSPKEGDKGTLEMLKDKFERRKALSRGEQQ